MHDVRPYLDRLAELAHAEGGWGYAPGQAAHLEPTCLALLALTLDPGPFATIIDKAKAFLAASAAADGSYRLMRGREEDRGKQGRILRVYPKTGRVLVEGVNIVKKHRRARRPEEQSGILEVPAPIAASKVMLLDPTTGAPTRTRKQVAADGTKTRVSVKSGAAIAAPAPNKG